MTEENNNAGKIESLHHAIEIVNPEKWESSRILKLNKMVRNYKNDFPHGTWFRGQTNEKWELKPSLFRNLNRDESNIVRRTKAQLCKYHIPGMSNLDWLCIMQHHNCPTRLLDFTENILYALFFAVEDEDNQIHGALFVLNAFVLNYYTTCGMTQLYHDDLPVWLRGQLAEDANYKALLWQIKKERPGDIEIFQRMISTKVKQKKLSEYLRKPAAFWPQYLHNRASRQKSVFVVSGGSCTSKNFGHPIHLESLSLPYPFFMKFIIPGENKQRIKKDLKNIGIDRASLFPELEHQAKAISELSIPQITN